MYKALVLSNKIELSFAFTFMYKRGSLIDESHLIHGNFSVLTIWVSSITSTSLKNAVIFTQVLSSFSQQREQNYIFCRSK